MSDFIPSTGTQVQEGMAPASKIQYGIAGEVETHAHLPSKRPRSPSDTPSTDPSEESPPRSNAIERLTLRTLTYFAYDQFSVTGGHKELARIAKAFIESLIDERFPPPHRVDMSLQRKCTEFLFAPAASSLVWFVVRNWRALQTSKMSTHNSSRRLAIALKGAWTVLHRVARQALIYRLFFRIGSLRYSLASALGIVCCFFNESVFTEIIWVTRWPRHFSSSQGSSAILRSIIYALAFSLPLQRLSKRLQESPRRRGNVKKIIFALALSQSEKLMQRLTRLYALQSSAI